MERWYISDTHFGHQNIIDYCQRPFSNPDEMDEFLVAAWNKFVKPEDHVSHLGDVTIKRNNRDKPAFIKLIKSLNGHKRLYFGNHDHFDIQTYLDAGFEKVYATWRDESGIIFSHMPIHPHCLGSAKANVHGHIHTTPDMKPIVQVDQAGKVWIKPYINISCEQTNYRPITFSEVLAKVTKAVQEAEIGS